MRKFLLLCAIGLLLGLSTDAFAQGYYRRGGRADDRSDRQRIRRGLRSGQITRDEARRLRERQRQISAERRGYRSDGIFSHEERRDIRRDEREHDRLIRRYRRNNYRRSHYHSRGYHRRGDGYYRRGAGSLRHSVFGRFNRY